MKVEALDQALDRLQESLNSVREVSTDISSLLHTGSAIDPFIFQLAIFILSIFIGYYVVWAVTPALHTPLMAVTNAISSVIIVGALLAIGESLSGYAILFGFLALVFASTNIFGGFLVTQRMLAMYRKKER
ncbi:MAG: NAD(P) transhydrogenase subunit alpha [Candidatus Tokpelaia sp. JSC161]|jgi:NAD(P) transhydrogenase subunit alpha|nr:MAG: NAD(P) transhydrogenase subunit alpha [Candidatus Tokpelaia sp. JSC161]